jgi:hypothetical protein
VVGTFDRQTWRRVTGAQPNRFRKEGAMLSTTVEPECRQRPFVMSYAMTGLGSCSAADTVGSRMTIGAGAGDAPERIAPKVFMHSTIHPEADSLDAFGDRRANSPAVH